MSIFLPPFQGFVGQRVGPIFLGSYAYNTNDNVSTLTTSHTLVAGTDRILIACATWAEDVTSAYPTSIRYNGIFMTLADRIKTAGGAGANPIGSAIYYLLEAGLPANGANDCVVNFTGPQDQGIGLGVYTIEGAAQSLMDADNDFSEST